ncbi:MAG TPA: S46 family peptidase [Longimicrobiales bacterium]|nr:S46 family peptidase [Longimicrobiales bacterium]
MQIRTFTRRLAVLSVAFLAACASAQTRAPAPPTAGQQPAGGTADQLAAAALVPPDAAVRAAAGVTLKGTELGTMWTFENAPLDYWARTYNFRPTQEWLDRVRLSSLRLPGCSASFVSEDGLILTNHHCARGCVARNSTPEQDYVETGFYAATRAEEKVCPNSYVDQLVSIEDVTERVRAAQTPGLADADLAQATQRVIDEIAGACRQQAGSQCQVVTLFKGGQYQLYTYRRYTPVKLVMAPELQAGFFGGDYDNFVYPRYALDFAFLRAYEADGTTPVRTDHFFPFDPTGPEEGEPIFVTGNPGSTARLITVAQLMYERSYRHPMQLQLFLLQQNMIREMMKTATGQLAMQLRENLFGIENSRKKYEGELAGLRDTMLVATKIKWEQEFKQRAQTTAEAQQYLDVWDRLYQLQLRKLQLNPALNVANAAWLGGSYLSLPANLINFIRSADVPDAQRPPMLREANRANYERAITSQPADPARARMLLESHLVMAHTWLPAGHALLATLMRPGETPAQAAARLGGETTVGDPAVRTTLLQGGLPALRASTDPVVQLAVTLDSIYRELQPQYQALLAEETVQNQRLARALFAVYGTQLPPDATFTLRISDGVPQGYAYNSTIAPYKSTFYGMFARAAEFDNAEPFNLPPRFETRKGSINMAAPMDFVSTNDITGGNSGSPIIDREARIIGLAFDGNVEQLPNEYVFRTETGGRTVAVHSGGILEALRSIYQAQALVNELTGAR